MQLKIINHSSEDLYIPNLQNPLAIYKDHADITPIFHSANEYMQDRDFILSNIEDHLNKLSYDSILFDLQDKYRQAVAEFEWDIMYRLNPVDSVRNGEQWQRLKEWFNFFCSIKYVGIPIKSKDTVVFYQAIDQLFDKNGLPIGNFEIRFHRYQNNAFDLQDTVTIEGFRLFTPLLDTTVLGYKMYCNEVVPINTLKIGF